MRSGTAIEIITLRQKPAFFMGSVTDDSSSITILLVDDQALLRQALASLLATQDEFEIVGVASDGYEAIKQVAFYRPDVVLLDIEMPNLDGLSATRLINQRFPETKVIVLSAHDNEVYLRNALEAGAKAYLIKNTLYAELSHTVRLVCQGYSQLHDNEGVKALAEVNEAALAVNQMPPSANLASFSSFLQERQESVTLEEVLFVAKLSLDLLERFQPDAMQRLGDQLLAFSNIAIAVKEDIGQRLANEPKNLSLLYLRGVLSHHCWSQTEIAFSSLQTGFETGTEQNTSTEVLLLFYRQAALLQPQLAFRWLTQVSGPWDSNDQLPFLLKEAVKLFGANSYQTRSIFLIKRIRTLKADMLAQMDKITTLTQAQY